MKEAIYLGNMAFETRLRISNGLTYDILLDLQNRLYKILDANLHFGAKNVVLICSQMRELFIFYGPSVMFWCFLDLGVELEQQFLNHISLFKVTEQSRNLLHKGP